MSYPGFYVRFTPELLRFLKRYLEYALAELAHESGREPDRRFAAFEDIVIKDCSVVRLPASLATTRPAPRSRTVAAGVQVDTRASVRAHDPTHVGPEELRVTELPGEGVTALSATGGVEPPQDPHPRIGSIVVDCTNLEQMIRFWSEALHYVPQGPVRPDGAMLIDPRRKGPNLNISLSSEGPAKEYRLHLDIYVGEPIAELERFLKLGATVRHPPKKGHDFVELADPDGNPFCLIDIDYPKNRNFWGDDWSYGDHP